MPLHRPGSQIVIAHVVIMDGSLAHASARSSPFRLPRILSNYQGAVHFIAEQRHTEMRQ